jgi:rhamnosyl/mannosyltransferase
MNILQVAPYFHPHLGGIENHVYHLAQHLRARGHTVSVLTSRLPGTKEEEEIAGVRVLRERSWGFPMSTPVCPGMKRRVRELQADIVHAHTPPPLDSYYAAKGCEKVGRPLVLTYHCDPIPSNSLGNVMLSLYRRIWGPATLRRARKVIVTTKSYAATSLVAWRHDAEVVQQAVDTSIFAPTGRGAELRAKLGADRKTVVLFVGRMVPHKGVQHLLRAVPHLDQNVVAWLVGRGPELERMKKLAAELGAASRVSFFDSVDDASLPSFYDACDIFTLPSTSRLEAFGIAALQGMSTGKPVVVCDIPGVRDVVVNGVHGLVAEPANPESLAGCLNLLARDPEARKRMGAKGRERVEEEYAWSQVVPRIEAIYAQVLASSPARAVA